ncbi:MAG: hypothetical protein IJ764_05245 [Bacteroidales bacterium]|nr:hypothetical protein [Bacteroidales bacterium]
MRFFLTSKTFFEKNPRRTSQNNENETEKFSIFFEEIRAQGRLGPPTNGKYNDLFPTYTECGKQKGSRKFTYFTIFQLINKPIILNEVT